MLAEEWLGVYWHEEATSLLIVYVDDFKLAAKAEFQDGHPTGDRHGPRGTGWPLPRVLTREVRSYRLSGKLDAG